MAYEKCAPDDPRRCTGPGVDGQCRYLAVEGEDVCEKHLTAAGRLKHKRNKLTRYLIDQKDLAATYERQLDDVNYLDLKEEIILIQSLVEQRVNSIDSKAELIASIPGLNALMQRLESMKVSLLKMQQNLGKVLGKDALREFVKDIATILDEELTGIENKGIVMERIAERILDSLETVSKPPDNLNED